MEKEKGKEKQPTLKLELMLGGLFSKNNNTEHCLAMVVQEEQLYAMLHFITLTSSYNNYYTGVILEEFKKSESDELKQQKKL